MALVSNGNCRSIATAIIVRKAMNVFPYNKIYGVLFRKKFSAVF